MYPDQTEASASHFLAAMAWFRRLGITVRRVLTDNGPCSLARHFQRTCHGLGLKHRRTRPYTPRNNGKAERFIQTAIREWAFAQTSRTPAKEPPPCHDGPTNTTGTDHTPASTGNPPSADQASK